MTYFFDFFGSNRIRLLRVSYLRLDFFECLPTSHNMLPLCHKAGWIIATAFLLPSSYKERDTQKI